MRRRLRSDSGPGPLGLLLLGFVLLLTAGIGRAHDYGVRPDLGILILDSDRIVRGTITEGSRPESGQLVAAVRVDRVLKGMMTGRERSSMRFASDRNHGVRYAKGERVVLFLNGISPTCERKPCPTFSPQTFGNKFRITSFKPTGYDQFVRDFTAAATDPNPEQRKRNVQRAFERALRSPEKAVRDYAAEQLGRTK